MTCRNEKREMEKWRKETRREGEQNVIDKNLEEKKKRVEKKRQHNKNLERKKQDLWRIWEKCAWIEEEMNEQASVLRI